MNITDCTDKCESFWVEFINFIDKCESFWVEFVNFIDKYNGFFMVLITVIYVIATIKICKANSKSAEATEKQVEESRIQFEESNRAFVTADFEIIRNGMLTICIRNHGKRIANNVNIYICNEFIDNVEVEYFKEHMNRINHSKFTLGIGQSWYLSIGSNTHLKQLSKELLYIDISYCDNKNSYNERTVIDLKQYFWALLYESPIQDEFQEMKQISKSIKSIDNTLKRTENKITETREDNNV